MNKITILALVTLGAIIGCSAAESGSEEESGDDTQGDDDSPQGGSSGAGASSGGGPEALACAFEGMPTGFEAAAPWTIPAARCQEKFDTFGTAGALDYTLLAVDRESPASIVVTQDECDDDVGVKHWDVYDVEGEGYARAPRSFSLPASRCDTSWDALSKNGPVYYTTADFNLDGIVDLAVTGDDCDTAVGTKHWDLYAGSTDGFASAPVEYSIPAARCRAKFDAPYGRYSELTYVMVDLDADDAPDLVVTKDDCDDDVGTKRWDVYRGSATGFAATPTAFTLPAARCSTPYDAVAGTSSELRYGLVDLTADGAVDLVVTGDQCDAEVGTKRWDLYENERSGFKKASRAYALPTARCRSKLDQLSGGQDSLYYSLTDLSCDKRPELVVTYDECDDEVGTKRWDLYEGGADGFVQAPTALTLPAARCRTTWDRLAGTDAVTYGLYSLDAERSSLVVAADECDAEVGTKRWEQYPLKK